MSEWLGNGLQNRPHQFESGWNLEKREICQQAGLSFLSYAIIYPSRQGSGYKKQREITATVAPFMSFYR